MRRFKFNKELVITTVFFIACLFGYIFFPAKGLFQYRFVSLVFLIVLPFLYNKYFLKKDDIFRRFVAGNWKENLKWLALGLFFPSLLMVLIFVSTDILNHYFLPLNIKNNFGQFLIYELSGIAFTVLMYELFFRETVMRYYMSFFGKWSILIQFVFFVGLVVFLNLPYWFYISYLVFAPFAGWISYKSDSIWYSFLGQWLLILIIDAVFISLTVKL